MSLKFQCHYLCGPMDGVDDIDCHNWRDYMATELGKLGIIVFNPARKPNGLHVEDKQIRSIVKELIKQRRFREIREKYAPPIRNTDMFLVDNSNALIVNYRLDIPMCGTMEEIFWANRCKKPVLFHFENLDEVPPWLCYTFPGEYFFDSWNGMLDYIRRVDAGYDDYHLTKRRWYKPNMEELINTATELYESHRIERQKLAQL